MFYAPVPKKVTAPTRVHRLKSVAKAPRDVPDCHRPIHSWTHPGGHKPRGLRSLWPTRDQLNRGVR